MKCPHCKKEIEIEESYSNFGKIFMNLVISVLIVAFIGTAIDRFFGIEIIKFWMVIMLIVGGFYMVYGILYDCGKVKGRLFITNLMR